MKRAVLTGSSGLIGSALRGRLVENGYEIVKCFDSREGSPISEIDKFEPTEQIDEIFHLAAHCKVAESIENPEKTFNANVLGTFKVFEFARKHKVKKVVYFSSSRVLHAEKNPYTASKLYGEELCKAYWKCYGIKYLIIRPSTVYGPFFDKTERLVHKFIMNALTNKPLVIYGDPETKTLDFTYVSDFIQGLFAVLRQDNKEFNISGGCEYNVYKLAKMIIEKTNSKSEIIVKPAEKEQPQQVHVDISPLLALGFRPRVSLEEGIERTINFYQKWLKENKQLVSA